MKKYLFILFAGCLYSMILWASPPQTYAQDQMKASNVENYKFIFKGTPFVKYADENGVITIPSNYYHHKYEKLRSFGYTLQSWSGSNGKTYLPDNIVTDSIVTRDTLTSDVILTPNFVLNEEDLGDATVTALWEFGMPDSVALFRNFQNVFSFVKPTLFNSYYIDMNMTINATEGWIDNEHTGSEGYAEVGAGTKFMLPARYGTIYKMVTKDALSATTIADSTTYKTTVDANGNYVEPGYIPLPTDQRFAINLFFQDHVPFYTPLRVHLNFVFSSGLPYGAPNAQRYQQTLRMPWYRRVDVGFLPWWRQLHVMDAKYEKRPRCNHHGEQE